MRYCIIKPVLDKYNLDLLFSSFNFFLLVLSTLLIAAAGYLINDYFDVEHDKNTDKQNVIDKGISKKLAFNIYVFFNIVAIAIAFYISSSIGFYKLGIVFLLIAGLLWFYSTSFKTSFLFGNFIIALIAALVPLIVLPYELLLQFSINKDALIAAGNNLNQITFWILGYSAFAFLMTFIREIIKDMQDYDADLAFNYNTLPLVAGIRTTKFVVAALISFTLFLLIYISIKFVNFNVFQLIYFILFILLPISIIGILIFKSKKQKQFKTLSLLTKITMFTGILYALTFCL